jgi:hypothetical protein
MVGLDQQCLEVLVEVAWLRKVGYEPHDVVAPGGGERFVLDGAMNDVATRHRKHHRHPGSFRTELHPTRRVPKEDADLHELVRDRAEGVDERADHIENRTFKVGTTRKVRLQGQGWCALMRLAAAPKGTCA